MVPALIFNDQSVTMIERDGEPWVTATELGRVLGYTDPDAVSKLYRRHEGLFAKSKEPMTEVISLPGQQGKVRVYNLRGCQCIGLKADTPVSDDFVLAVLDLLERERKQNRIVQNTAATLYEAALTKFTGFRQTVYAEDIEKAAGLLPGQATEEAWVVLAEQLEKLRPFCAQMKFKTTGAPVRFFQSMTPDQLKLNKGATLDELMPDPDPKPLVGIRPTA